jgi:tyrosyl-tRNA synthetase
MTEYKSDLLRLLSERGYIHQITDAEALDALARAGIVPGYIGFDATAPSLHVGSLVQIMLLRRLQQAGHKPIVLMGGGTSKIGDPSFKDEARKLLTTEMIAANIASIQRIFARFITFGDGPTDAVMLDNAEWLDKLEYIPFLREVGQHFSVNRMLSFDSVKLRLDREQSLSFLEFNYMILQAYDFMELARRAGCRLQMGGSDQWGNIVNGIELARRMDGTEVYGVTTPLITTADGGALPTVAVPPEGMGIVQANTALGFTASNKEAKRKIGEGAVRVNGEQVFDAAYVVRPGDKLSLGHKKHGLVVAE